MNRKIKTDRWERERETVSVGKRIGSSPVVSTWALCFVSFCWKSLCGVSDWLLIDLWLEAIFRAAPESRFAKASLRWDWNHPKQCLLLTCAPHLTRTSSVGRAHPPSTRARAISHHRSISWSKTGLLLLLVSYHFHQTGYLQSDPCSLFICDVLIYTGRYTQQQKTKTKKKQKKTTIW